MINTYRLTSNFYWPLPTIVSQALEIPGSARILPITGMTRRTLIAAGKKPPKSAMNP